MLLGHWLFLFHHLVWDISVFLESSVRRHWIILCALKLYLFFPNVETLQPLAYFAHHILQVELTSLLDAVQETETKMVEMSALNHLMSTHVLQQAQQIEHLYEQVSWYHDLLSDIYIFFIYSVVASKGMLCSAITSRSGIHFLILRWARDAKEGNKNANKFWSKTKGHPWLVWGHTYTQCLTNQAQFVSGSVWKRSPAHSLSFRFAALMYLQTT